MQQTVITIVIAVLCCFTSTSLIAEDDASTSQLLTTNAEDLSQSEAATVQDFIFGGRVHAAIAYLDSLNQTGTSGPFYLIMRAKCYQEFVPMDDVNTEYGKMIAAKSLDELDRCIELCSKQLDDGDTDPMLYFYRGWAWMAKSYVRSMTRSLWTAGREAGRGKKDLKRYLEMYPDDPTANGLMGGFLYFADTIPKAFKFLSKLLRLPSGDREQGIQMLELAIHGGGLLKTDWELVLYNVYFYFEGRYEEGLAGLLSLSERYPEHARTAIPLAVSQPYMPRLIEQNDRHIAKTIHLVNSGPHSEVDWNALYLVQVYRAYTARYFNSPRVAGIRLRSIVHEAPNHPDWVQGFARLQLGSLHASLGEFQEAREVLESVVEVPAFSYYRDPAKRILKDLDKYAHLSAQAPGRPEEQWITALYRSSIDSLPALEARFAALASLSLPASFYMAECRLLAGNYDGALPVYKRIIESEAPAWQATFQMLSATRSAEIMAARGYYKAAVDYQKRSNDFFQREYLVDWVLEGRQRYFERLADGEESVTPTLLSTNP